MSELSANAGPSSAELPLPTYLGSVEEEERRPQAGPLPSKRGEIGFVAGVHTPTSNGGNDHSDSTLLPARHPADREQATPSPTSSNRDVEAGDAPSESASSINSITKSTSNRFLAFLKPKKIPTVGGIQITTIILFTVQILFLAGTVVAWVFTTTLINKTPSDDDRGNSPASSAIFIHLVFVIGTMGQLIFFERRLFRLRAERYSFLHPGEVLPRHRHLASSPQTSTSIAFAPWNRPPLPTYAAALAQSGVGTGDVEDNLIAAPPPPAYGNTRGSTLLLAGFLRDSLRAQRPRSAASMTDTSRPVSYASRDYRADEDRDAERSRQLEETLHRLEANPSAPTPTTRS